MDFLDYTKMELYHYLYIGGGILAVLALILCFLPAKQLKVPGVLVGIVGGLAAGIGVGVLGMTGFGYHWDREPPQPQQLNEGGGGGGPGGPGGGTGKGGMGKGGMGKGGMGKGGMGKGGGGPNSIRDLGRLITKLDQLTGKSLVLNLTPEQQAKVSEQLAGVTNVADLSEEEAKKKLDALLTVVEGQKATLQAAGYAWPGEQQRGGGGTSDVGDHLKALEKRLKEKP